MTLLNTADKVYLGAALASRVYLGATKVWPPAAVGPTPPTIGLTGQWDASDPSKLGLNEQATPPFYNGTVTDGAQVKVWLPTAGPWAWTTPASNLPDWRSTTPLMKLPCLDWVRDTNDIYSLWDLSGASLVGPLNMSNLIGDTNKTIALALYVETLPSTNGANYYNNVQIFADESGYVGVALKAAGFIFGNWASQARWIETSISTGVSYVFICRQDGVNLFLRVCRNGFADVDVTPTLSNPTNAGSLANQARMGLTGSGSVFGGSYRVGELITYNTFLTGADLTQLTDYLKTKWLA